MLIDSKLSKNDYISINIAMIFRRVSTYILLAFCFIFLLIGLVFTVVLESYIFLIIWGIFVVFVVAVYASSIYRFANSKENEKMFLPVHYEFKDDAVTLTSTISKEETSWAVFVKWRVLAGHYLLFVNNLIFLAIKMENVSDKEEFEKMLREKVKKP